MPEEEATAGAAAAAGGAAAPSQPQASSGSVAGAATSGSAGKAAAGKKAGAAAKLGRNTCETICIAFTLLFFAAIAATLFYFGAAFQNAKCSEPLPVWCLIAGGIILGTTIVFLLDYLLPSWKGLLYQIAQERKPNGVATWFTVLSIAQVTLLVSFVAAFIYGAYAVLAIFGRQRNASPGTEVCNRQLYDPLFFIVILFDLVLVIGLLLLLCLNCDALCCCWVDPADAAVRKSKKTDGSGDASGAGKAAEAQQPLLGAASPVAGGASEDGTKPKISDATYEAAAAGAQADALEKGAAGGGSPLEGVAAAVEGDAAQSTGAKQE